MSTQDQRVVPVAVEDVVVGDLIQVYPGVGEDSTKLVAIIAIESDEDHLKLTLDDKDCLTQPCEITVRLGLDLNVVRNPISSGRGAR